MGFSVVRWPDKNLATPTIEVPVADFYENRESLELLVEEMTKALYREGGIGLAANQVGDSRSVFIAILDKDISGEGSKPTVFVNPTLDVSLTRVPSKEGCLSIPGVVSKLKCRSREVNITACSISGRPFKVMLEGLDAVVVQHEMDHLLGITMLDKMSRVDRRRAKNKVLTQARRRNRRG
ncbi:MAG: peptide deformylase [Deltaproteobacteria bacterium]|nr:peptide deformylase [Deltaproteobacteria bacterium]